MNAPPATLPVGHWGGEQVALIVGPDEAVLRLSCAEGRLAAPITLDDSGRFSASGHFTQHGGGPSVSSERPVKATYEGVLLDGQLKLNVRHGAARETYTLTHGLQSKVIRCL